MLFTCTKYIVGGILLGCGSFSGVLHVTTGFLKPLKSFEGSLVNGENDGGFWYLSTIRLQYNDFTNPFVPYPYPESREKTSGSDDDGLPPKLDFSMDKKWTDQIREKCIGFRNSMNFVINDERVKILRK